MARVDNLVETESHDSTALKGNENQSKQAEKLGGIAVDLWQEMERTYKDASSKNGKMSTEKNSFNNDGGSKEDKFSLTFDDPYKSLDGGNLIQKKKETALEEANLIQKKKELAAAGKPGATVEGGLEFSPDKPKIPADGGLKDNVLKDWQNPGKPVDGGKKPSLDGGLKDPAFDKDYFIQKL